MIEDELAREGVDLLSVAIASIIEDVHPEAVLTALRSVEGRTDRFALMGEDIIALAAAIRVLQRRAGVMTADDGGEPAA